MNPAETFLLEQILISNLTVLSAALVLDNLFLQMFNKLHCVILCFSAFVAKDIFMLLKHQNPKIHKIKLLLLLSLQSYLTDREILYSNIIDTKKKIL